MMGEVNGIKFINYGIPKCASNSFYNSLRSYLYKKPDEPYYLCHQIRKQVEVNLDDYFKFCIVRNPWDRMISLYFWGRQIHDVFRSLTFDEFLEQLLFGKMVKAHPGRYKWAMNQTEWISDSQNEIDCDYIGKFEELPIVWNIVCNQLGIDVDLKHNYRTKHKNYREYYTNKTKKIVGNHFKKDIDFFAYDF
jgi:hypothetical protein